MYFATHDLEKRELNITVGQNSEKTATLGSHDQTIYKDFGRKIYKKGKYEWME